MSEKLVNIITCDNMKADVVLLADGKITVMEFSQMHKKIEKLEASNKELLEALEFCCTNNCERKLWYKQNRTTPPFDMPKEKCIDCPVMETIEKTKGLLNG